MHDTALMFGDMFFKTYLKHIANPTIIDIGSLDINGSLRSVAPQGSQYLGLDLDHGKGVDVVLSDPYKYPIQDQQADAVVCSSCLEHTDMFWISFLEILRITKPTGVIYLQMPSQGEVHRYPIDSWRFYPDSGRSLEKWARYNQIPSLLLESFIGARQADQWRDCVMVFVKDEQYQSMYTDRIAFDYSDYANLTLYGDKELIRFTADIS